MIGTTLVDADARPATIEDDRMITTAAVLRGMLMATLAVGAHSVRTEAVAAEPAAAAEQSGGNRHRRPDRGQDDAPMACIGVVGTWRWFDRGTVTIAGDLRAEWRDGATNRVGHTANGECDRRTGAVTFAWTNGVTDVIQRPSGSSLQGRNNMGMTIWASRLTGPDQRRPEATPAPRVPARAPGDGVPASPPSPAPSSGQVCASTFAEVQDANERGMPPLLLATRLAEHPLAEAEIPADLRGPVGSPQVSTRRVPDTDGLCATVRFPVANGGSSLEYRVYAPRAASPRLPYVIDEAKDTIFQNRQFNNDPRKFCDFVDGRSLSIGCTWGEDVPWDESLRQFVAIARHRTAGGNTGAIETVRQLAAAGQKQGYAVINDLRLEQAAWLMAEMDGSDGAPRSEPRTSVRKVIPVVLGLGALAVVGGLGVLAGIAVVVAVLYVRSRNRRRGEPPPLPPA